jgi:Sec7-like guanine-nucleotide exchange factor
MPISSEKKKNEIVFLDMSLKDEEADSSNMLVNFYQNTWLHHPEDNVHTHCHEKFKSGDITHSLLAYMHPPPTTHC